ncbi:MAG TPA: DNA polymerase III subunit gamma/tau [Anaerolineaceae bacterium]|nr:DNA polymerase III subunit gamma/tau [Anaerolineaceae bacterium]HPN50366.1 DNA polymerase III subunit gamma/tau [Anaerolineaceae bacterium]
MSQAFYRKYRPHLWEEVVGQEHIIQTLRNAVAADRVAHAYLFAGPRGTGKTTSARLLAKAVNCLEDDPAKRPCDQCAHCKAVNEGRFMDLIEIDAASNTSVDDVRDLRDKINFSPSQGKFKVYIIDEVHMLSTAAFNALLKTLEEPPPHAIFILATTEVHKIPATVLSRCQRHEFRRVSVPELARLLGNIVTQEKLTVDAEALTLIARQATGGVRDAVSLLDQLASIGKPVDLALAQTVLGTATSQAVVALVDAILKKDSAAGLNLIQQTLDAGADPRQFARQVVDYLRSLMLFLLGNAAQVDATQDMRAQMAAHARAFKTAELVRCLRAFNQATSDPRGAWQPGLALELAFADCLEAPQAAQPVVTVVQQAAQPAAAAPAAAPQPSQPRPADAPAAQPAPAAPAGDLANTGLQAVMQNWVKIRLAVKKHNGRTEALLNSGKPVGVKDGALILGFASEVLKSKMESDENIQITRLAIQQVLGVTLQIRCVVSAGKAANLPADMEVDAGGMVDTALRDLGAEVVQAKKINS